MALNCILNEYKRGGCASCSPQCAYKIAIDGRQKAARVPSDYRAFTLANTPIKSSHAKIYETLQKYVATFKRMFDENEPRIKSLYLYSANPGTGKTTSATTLANEWIIESFRGAAIRNIPAEMEPAYFLDVNEWQSLFNKFNRRNVPESTAKPASADYYARLTKAKLAPFCVLDDIGVRSATEAFRSDLHEIINHRTVNAMPTVYTSNVTIAELAQVFDKRLADRVRDQCGVVAFEGESKRGRR